MLCYCKRCGRVVSLLEKELNEPCDYCNNRLHIVPKEFTADKLGTCLDDDLEQQFIDECIKYSPEFDQYLFDHRDEDLFKRRMENNAKMEHGRAILGGSNSNIPKCPTCGSTNLERISLSAKVVSTALFGLFSTKRSKTFKCNNCGYEW